MIISDLKLTPAGQVITRCLFKVASILGGFYKDQAASAFGIFKFVQSLASAISFFYSPFLGFHWQLLILAIFCVAGTGTFVKLDLIATKSVTYK